MSAVLFFIAAIGAITGAFGVVMLRNPFYSVLALAFHLVSLAALFLLLRAEFVAAAQVIVYVGGGEQLASRGALRVLGPLFALALAIELCIAMLGAGLKGVSSRGAAYVPGFGSPGSIGRLFLTKFLFPFEIASILLLVAAVGAVVLARRRRGLEPDQQTEARIHQPRPAYTGTMAEAAGVRQVVHGEAVTPEPVGSAAGDGAGSPGSEHEGGW